MKIIETLKKLLREVRDLIVKFIKPYGLKDEILEIPDNLKKVGYKVGFCHFMNTAISLAFSFMLKITNIAIEAKFVILGIIIFMLYRGSDVITSGLEIYINSEEQKLTNIFDNETIYKGGKIIGKISGKVMKYNEDSRLYKIMSNEESINCINNYLKNFWQQKIRYIFSVLEIIGTFIMLLVAIVTNTSISQKLFIPMLLSFSLICFLCNAFIVLHKKEFHEVDRELDNKKSVLTNDLLRVPIIVNEDLGMRIKKFKETMVNSHNNLHNFYHKEGISEMFIAVLEVFCQYAVIVFYLMALDWSTIDLSTITAITANLVIVETVLSRTKNIVKLLRQSSERIAVMEKESEDMQLILDVYKHETERRESAKVIENININPFSIKYIEESENDKPFTLVSEKAIAIQSGEIAILYGPSGSGKSTFMKMLTERIRIEKSTEIPATSRFLYYDETLRFGSLNIYEELFCSSQNPDYVKMQEILENLHLWCEIKSNCIDIWKWMKEKKFDQSLSNGQKQRLILAKLLYWLDDDVDVLVLDECTSGLDDKTNSDSADAEKILEYIVRYANSNKKRIVIISTHQNIDGFKAKISDEFTFRNFQFFREGDINKIKEI